MKGIDKITRPLALPEGAQLQNPERDKLVFVSDQEVQSLLGGPDDTRAIINDLVYRLYPGVGEVLHTDKSELNRIVAKHREHIGRLWVCLSTNFGNSRPQQLNDDDLLQRTHFLGRYFGYPGPYGQTYTLNDRLVMDWKALARHVPEGKSASTSVGFSLVYKPHPDGCDHIDKCRDYSSVRMLEDGTFELVIPPGTPMYCETVIDSYSNIVSVTWTTPWNLFPFNRVVQQVFSNPHEKFNYIDGMKAPGWKGFDGFGLAQRDVSSGNSRVFETHSP